MSAPTERIRWTRWLLASCLASLVGFSMGGLRPAKSSMVSARPAAPAEIAFENMTVLVGSYELSAQLQSDDEVAGSQIHASLESPDGRVRARTAALAGADGSLELRFESRGLRRFEPRRIAPGDRIRFRSPDGPSGAEASLTVPVLTAEIEVATGRLSGRAPAGAPVYLTAFDAAGGFLRESVTASEEGRYQLEMAGRLDLGPGAHGSALILDGSTAFQASWARAAAELEFGSAELGLRLRPGERVRARLLDARGGELARAEAYDRAGRPRAVLRDPDGQPVPLMPGSRLEIDFDAGDPAWFPAREPLRVDLPAFLAELDLAGDRLAGRTDPGQRLIIDGASQRVELQADDRYGFFQGALPDFDPSLGLRIEFPDRPGLRATLRPPALAARHARLAIVEATGSPGARAELSVEDAAGNTKGRVAGRIGADGRSSLSLREAPGPDGSRPALSLEAGDHLHLAVESFDAERAWTVWRRSSLSHRPLEARVDSGADRLTGHAAPFEMLRVRLIRPGIEGSTRADAQGRWSMDFRDRFDLRAGERATIEAEAAETGSLRHLEARAFRALPQANGERLRIEGQPGQSFGAEVERGGRIVARGGCQIQTGASDCQSLLHAASGAPLWLDGGDLVVVSAEGEGTAAIDLVPMSAHIDRSGRDVVGVAPVEDQVEIRFFNDQGAGLPLDTGAGTDENGVYDHELAASEWDQLVPGLMAEVSYARSRGHRQLALGLIEQLRYTRGVDEVSILAEPGQAVTLSLEVACPMPEVEGCEPQLLQRSSGSIPGDGRLTLPLAAARPDARQDRFLRLEHSRGEIRLPLRELAAWTLDGSPALQGVAPPFADLRAFYYLHPDAESDWLAVEGRAGFDGLFQLPEPPLSPSDIAGIELRLYAEGGGEQALRVDPAQRPMRILLPSLTR